ncbi:MAG: hypothetical protein HGA86_06675 [Anaerolineaceae bacterium]|nr:hypothetical protein [Anaerolineaceae bacterium]
MKGHRTTYRLVLSALLIFSLTACSAAALPITPTPTPTASPTRPIIPITGPQATPTTEPSLTPVPTPTPDPAFELVAAPDASLNFLKVCLLDTSYNCAPTPYQFPAGISRLNLQFLFNPSPPVQTIMTAFLDGPGGSIPLVEFSSYLTTVNSTTGELMVVVPLLPKSLSLPDGKYTVRVALNGTEFGRITLQIGP